MDTALGRTEFLKENELKESNANYIFDNYYSSALEMLHALLLLHGYKVINHICTGFYLRDVLGKNELFRIFDDCRKKRNYLIYYGRKMNFEVAKAAIEKCIKFIQRIKDLTKKELNQG